MRARFALLIGLFAIGLTVFPAHARTIEAVSRAVARAEKKPKRPPGSEGTIGAAIAKQAKKVHHPRPQTEGTIAELDPDGRCPVDMANVGRRFCVDRWEGSLEEIAPDGSNPPWPATTVLDSAKSYRAVSKGGLVPQAYISGSQALDACRAADKRLCNASEWRLACTGSEGTIYPYGPTHVGRRCNDYGLAPMYVFYPKVAMSWAGVTNTDMNDPRLNLLENTVAKTGAHEDCVNDWGLYDMVGNLHEWTSDPYGTFQGGFYLDTAINGEGCAYRTTAHDFDYHDYSTGFRCCSDLKSLPDDED